MKKTTLIAFAFFLGTNLMAQPPKGDAKKGETYGNFEKSEKKYKIENLKSVKDGDVVQGYFQGEVEEVCSKKGCWIKLKLKNGETATIKMKDYAFFVPSALVGKKVIINGEASLKTVSVAELQHIAEDAGKSKEEIAKITEAEETISIMANGIMVK